MGYDLTMMDAFTRPWTPAPRDAEFWASWGAMGRYVRELMEPSGMVHSVAVDHRPDWPEPEQYGTTEHAVLDWMHDGGALQPGVLGYWEAFDKVMAWAPEAPGIPVWKVSGNDPWIITPLEIQGAFAMWDGREGDEGFAALLSFLRASIDRGGVRVS